MPAKKKRTTVDWRARADLAGRSALVAIQENDGLSKRLAEANELLEKGKETMRENAGGLVEAAEALVAKNTELVELQKKLTAETRELEFWVEESDRFRNQVVELLRHLAVEQAKRGGGS